MLDETLIDEVAMCLLARLTGVHIAVHLRGGDVWTTCIDYSEEACLIHLLYLGDSEYMEVRMVPLQKKKPDQSLRPPLLSSPAPTPTPAQRSSSEDEEYVPTAPRKKCGKRPRLIGTGSAYALANPLPAYEHEEPVAEESEVPQVSARQLRSSKRTAPQPSTPEPSTSTDTATTTQPSTPVPSTSTLSARELRYSKRTAPPQPSTPSTPVPSTAPQIIGTLTFKKVALRRSKRIKLAYNCRQCSKRFGSMDERSEHVAKEHHNFKCSNRSCQAKFATTQALRNHITRSHTAPTIICKKRHCSSKFHYESDMLRHMIVHMKTKAFVCEECGAAYKFKGELTQHQQIHGAQLYSCLYPGCGYTSRSKKYLKQHDDGIHGKGFKCECGFTFQHRPQFQRHKNDTDCNGPYVKVK